MNDNSTPGHEVANESNSLPLCAQFATNADFDQRWPECQVCGHLELSHATPGRRALATAEIDVLRQSLIDASERYHGASN